MSEYSPIPIKKTPTRPLWDAARQGEKHDRFAQRLLALWNALTPVERAEILSRQAQQEA